MDMKSPFRYSPLQKELKKLYRKFNPVPTSPYTLGEVKDICEINLVPQDVLVGFFKEKLKLLKTRRSDLGDYLEFGIFNGSSLSSMYVAVEESGSDIRYFGFDAFEGLPEESESEDDGTWQKGFYTCSFEQMEECLEGWGVDPEKVNWVKGWYNETLTVDFASSKDINPGIVFIDCDTYSSSKSVLDFLAPLIKEPTIICLDDWKLYDLDIKGMGEYKSFNEFVEQNTHFKFTELSSYNRKSKTFLVEIG